MTQHAPLQKIKVIDTGRFVDVNLDEMHIPGDAGDWTLRLREPARYMSQALLREFQSVILHALNGRRKSSTVYRWTTELIRFLKTSSDDARAPLSLIDLGSFNKYAAQKNASQQKLLRSSLKYWAARKFAGISPDLTAYLSVSKAPKPRSTSEIQNSEPKERPFPIETVRKILARIDELFFSGAFTPQDNALWRLIVSEGMRPAQLRLLNAGDLRFELTKGQRTERAFLHVPIVKQKSTPGRSYMEEFRLSEGVAAALRHHIAFLEQVLGCRPDTAQPLFCILELPPEGYIVSRKRLDITKEINRTRKAIAGGLQLDDSELFTRRFKHTKLTHLAVLGAPLDVLARAGFQTSTISLRHYVNLTDEAFADLEDRLQSVHSEICDSFRGRIIDQSQATNKDVDHEVLDPKLEDAVGSCSGNPCDVFAPVGCYVCPRFEAFIDGPHGNVLSFLEKRMNAATRTNSSEAVVRDMHLVSAVQNVIQEIKKFKNGS